MPIVSSGYDRGLTPQALTGTEVSPLGLWPFVVQAIGPVDESRPISYCHAMARVGSG
jgi:hypothetical protein